jgi:hypothetical protein
LSISKTAQAVGKPRASLNTPLKQGVNETVSPDAHFLICALSAGGAFEGGFERATKLLAAPFDKRIMGSRFLSDGVMVTQRPLEALFMVRIHVGQPIIPMKMRVLWMFAQNLHNNRHERLTVA